MKISILLCPVIISGLAGCAAAYQPSLFTYASGTKMEVTEKEVVEKDAAVIRRLTFGSPELKSAVWARLVRPKGDGPFAGVIFLHKYPGDETQFLPEAELLAGKGVVSLLVAGRFPWKSRPAGLTADREGIIRQIIELRYAVDLLLLDNAVDPERIGFVGMDYGAMHGAVLSGIERRIKCFVLIAGTARFAAWNGIFTLESSGREYEDGMSRLDPIVYVGHSSPAPLFFQFAEKDTFIPRQTAEQFYAAAGGPKRLLWYDSGHETVHEVSQADRIEWLSEQLGLE